MNATVNDGRRAFVGRMWRPLLMAAGTITKHYYEYLHMANTGEKWVIVNALYEGNTSK